MGWFSAIGLEERELTSEEKCISTGYPFWKYVIGKRVPTLAGLLFIALVIIVAETIPFSIMYAEQQKQINMLIDSVNTSAATNMELQNIIDRQCTQSSKDYFDFNQLVQHEITDRKKDFDTLLDLNKEITSIIKQEIKVRENSTTLLVHIFVRITDALSARIDALAKKVGDRVQCHPCPFIQRIPCRTIRHR